jgi:hypothetical protein
MKFHVPGRLEGERDGASVSLGSSVVTLADFAVSHVVVEAAPGAHPGHLTPDRVASPRHHVTPTTVATSGMEEQ